MTETPILDDSAVSEIEAMFPNAEYQPTLSPDEVDPCEFCKGTIDDHKANCVVPHVHALCATVKHLRAELHKWEDNHDRLCLQREQMYRDVHAKNAAQQSQLEQLRAEKEDLRRQVLELEERL